MTKKTDDVIIKRRAAKAKPDESKKIIDVPQEVNPPKDNRPLFAKIFAALLGIFAILLFLALVSYTQKDELNAHVTLSDFTSIFSSDSMIRIKADTTYNWLGLLGAVISNILINWTIGYWILFLPIFVFTWALNVYKSIEIPEKLIRSTSIYLIFSVLLATFIAGIRNAMATEAIPKEYSGSIGIFLAAILGKLIGDIGVILLFLSLMVLVVVFGTNIKWKPIIEKMMIILGLVKKHSTRTFRFLFVKVKRFEQTNKDLLKDAPFQVNEEPALAEENLNVIIDENLTSEEKISDEPKSIVIEEKELVIKTSSTEQAKIIRNSFKPNIKINPASAEFCRIDEKEETPETALDNFEKSRIEKQNAAPNSQPREEILPEQLLGLRKDLDEETIEISTRSRKNLGEKSLPESIQAQAETALSQDISKQNKTPDPLSPSEKSDEQNNDIAASGSMQSANSVNNTKNENMLSPNEIPAAAQNQENTDIRAAKEKNPLEYFNVDEIEKEIIIDEALIIKGKTPSEVPKPILPPTPVKLPQVTLSVPTKYPAQPATNTSSAAGRSPLVVHLEDQLEEDSPALNTPLGVAIHDEEIDYEPPTITLLDRRPEEGKVSDDELKNNARILQEKLETFKIFIEDLTVTPGPVVTQYEFVPAAGIKISRIESLSDDLAMALKAKGIRIIAPIPGKGTVGIEIPNLNPSVVRFSHVVNTNKFYESTAKLPIALGKTISGEVLITDLTKSPHLMIAGSTGSGKSVGINTIINSLLYRMKPSDLKFVIVDPKKVELQQYSRLRHHFLAISPDIDDSIITNPADAVAVLKSVVIEMENRYNILARVGQRNIADYNDKVKAGVYKTIKDFDHRPMPYIVVIIDELADLMLTAGKEVEEPIIRLAQMARAIGIHLIIATQRPSVDVITGIIKANFPARIAYLVASKVDSRTILDVSGAEQLLGNGDMLFLPGGSPKPLRIQNAFISTDEVDNICNFIGKQDGYSQPYLLPSLQDEKTGAGALSADERDPLFEDSARLVINHQQASVSLIQRRMKVGYARAGRIIDELEDAGIVGPNEGSKARIVLYESQADLERIL